MNKNDQCDQDWSNLESLENQLAEVISKLSEPLIQTMNVVFNRINDFVKLKAQEGTYLGGNSILQVITENELLVARAGTVIEAVMETLADKLVAALDFKIETSNNDHAGSSRVPGLTSCTVNLI